MGWSTQEVADLAGTTLRTVRHYHEIGLLPEPDRGSNGYKSYGVTHLTQLLRIRRLVEFGAPLSEIRELELSRDEDHASERYAAKLRDLDSEAAQAIARLQAIRVQISAELDADDAGPLSAPAHGTGGQPPPADDDFMTVVSRVLSEESTAAWNRFRTTAADQDALAEFTDLAEGSPAATVEGLAGRLAEVVGRLHADVPELADPTFASRHGRRFGRQALELAMVELYNDAQLAALARTGAILRTRT